MKFPVKDNEGNEYNEEQYNALTVIEKKEKGFLFDPEVVYWQAADKLHSLGYTTVNGEKIPVDTKLFDMEYKFFTYKEKEEGINDEESVKGPSITFANNKVTIKVINGKEAYYTTDGTAPTFDKEHGTVSGTKITADKEIILSEGNEFTIKAVYAIKNTDDEITGISAVSSKKVKYVAPPKEKVATPVITITGTEATINCATDGATILARKNSEAFAETSSFTGLVNGDKIEAKATKEGMDDSSVATKTVSLTVSFTLSKTAATVGDEITITNILPADAVITVTGGAYDSVAKKITCNAAGTVKVEGTAAGYAKKTVSVTVKEPVAEKAYYYGSILTTGNNEGDDFSTVIETIFTSDSIKGLTKVTTFPSTISIGQNGDDDYVYVIAAVPATNTFYAEQNGMPINVPYKTVKVDGVDYKVYYSDIFRYTVDTYTNCRVN